VIYDGFVDTAAIAHLLQPFIQLDELRLNAISKYIDVLMKWNARVNLTAIRAPEEIVQRHFGESLFVAQYVLAQRPVHQAIDLGSGAGFPGVPLAILAPEVQVILIESNQKKATFLKELIRVLGLRNSEVFADRGENYEESADLVCLRAVEKFETALPLAVKLTKAAGRVALLVGSSQLDTANRLTSGVEWDVPILVPSGHSRILLLGTKVVNVD
jgi:16S rRNA (guanine527-N7)-methyltransferase